MPAVDPDLRKRRGAWYTPPDVVDLVVSATVTPDLVAGAVGDGRPVRVVDPACGDGRFLAAAAERVADLDPTAAVELVGVDVDPGAVAAAAQALPAARLVVADALTLDWGPVLADRHAGRHAAPHAGRHADIVVGNPPFLSQLAAATTRGGASRRGGGPYADAAAEFLALAAELVRPDGGRLGLVLPQSLLAARDAAPIRRAIDERAAMVWSWWSPDRHFDGAQVLTCAVVFEFGRRGDGASGSWAHVVTGRVGVPPVALDPGRAGTLGDRAVLNANFRDEYYGMIPAVGDHPSGPPLITSGTIDPGITRWGRRPVTFAKRRFAAPRLDLDRLDDRMRAWAERRLVPKVLVANQTPVIEAVADPDGAWLPAVPVVAAYPRAGVDVEAIAAVLTSPVASAWAWHRQAGTGLSATTIRLGPAMLAELPWPAGSLDDAVAALDADDPVACGVAVTAAFGLTGPEADRLVAWWAPVVTRLRSRPD